MKLYIVVWARALGNENTPVDAFAGCVGSFTNFNEAREGMLTEIQSMLQDVRSNYEDEEDLKIFEDSLKYADDSFCYTIDYTTPDDVNIQWYYTIQEIEVPD